MRCASLERWAYGWELPPADDDPGCANEWADVSARIRYVMGLPARPGTLR